MNTLPIDSLWDACTKVAQNQTPLPYMSITTEIPLSEMIMSGIVLGLFLLLVVFSKALANIIPILTSSVFRLKKALTIENTLALSTQRDNVALVSVIYLAIATTLVGAKKIQIGNYNGSLITLFTILAGLIVLIIIKKFISNIFSWFYKDRQTFYTIFKTSYNYLIIAAILTIPIIAIRFITLEIPTYLLFLFMITCFVLAFTLYLFRIFRLFIFYRYSYIFNILYLCCVEILPIALIIHLIYKIG